MRTLTLIDACACGANITVEWEKQGGDRVPYGSTWATTPEGVVVYVPEVCLCGHEFDQDDKEYLQMLAMTHIDLLLDDEHCPEPEWEADDELC